MDKLLDLIAQALGYLQGKKAVIMAILTAINAYAVAVNLYDAQLGALIATILSILAGGAVLATTKMGSRINK